MARTFIRQDAQIGSTADTLKLFDDTVAPSLANYQTNPADLTDDLNNIRSMLSYLKDIQAGNWYDVQTAPSTLEAGVLRGVDDLNDALHLIEKKRVLRDVHSLVDVTVGAGDNFVILGTGELPAQTTAAVGAVTTLGTVVASHTGTFGTHALDEVSGGSAIQPLNLMEIVDGATRDPILSSGRKVFGLLQGESGVTDGATITDTTTTRVQISFVRVNATGDDLEAVPVADIENAVINYCTRERVRLEDLNEADFLRGAIVDVPGGTTVDRQTAYDNQGTTPVELGTNATLDLNSAGVFWEIRDLANATLLRVTEGSGGGTSTVLVDGDVDTFDVDAVVNDFANGATLNSGGTRPIAVGVTDGVVESTAGDLRVNATGELFLDDGNQAGSTWAQTDGIKLSEDTAEWDLFETNFGEVSLLNAISQAFSGGVRTKVQAVLTANVSSGNDINGPGTPHNNTDVDLAPYDSVPNSFVDDVEVFLNGELLRNAPNVGGGEDVYPGGTPADGDLAFQFNLKGTGSKPDQLTVIVNGQ